MGLKYYKNVVTLQLEKEKCIGCKLCEIVCPHRIFKIENRKAEIINKDMCIECGACASNCPASAIKVNCGAGCAIAVVHEMFKKK